MQPSTGEAGPPTRWKKAGLLGLVAIPALGYGAILAGIGLTQEKLLFHPETLPADFSYSGLYPPEQDVEELSIAVDGAVLNALLFRQPDSRGLVFYLHGNGGNLVSWTRNVAFYRQLGFDLFMLDYRGFGKSTGHIASEAQLHADVRAAWARVAPGYAGKPVVILGRSLGSGLATRLALDTPRLAGPRHALHQRGTPGHRAVSAGSGSAAEVPPAYRPAHWQGAQPHPDSARRSG